MTAFSREVKNFEALRTMPILFRNYFKSKRNFALLICSLGSTAYIVAAGIVCVVFGVILPQDCWVILYGALVSFLLNIIIIDLMLLKDAVKPRLNWDSETEISRKLCWVNVVVLIVGFAAYIALMVVLAIVSAKILGDAVIVPVVIISVIAAAVIAVATILVDRFSVSKVEKHLMNYE